jgi:hypothetical protein
MRLWSRSWISVSPPALVNLDTDDDEIYATHQAPADELGSVRKSVSRPVCGFEDRGWFDLGRERIRFVHRTALFGLGCG